jgi:hypothetical protein
MTRYLFGWLALAFLASARMGAAAPDFDVRRDTLGWANETKFAYDIDAAGKLHMSKKAVPPVYSNRCFVMSRTALQFKKFARFTPAQPRVSREEYRRLVRAITRIPVWSDGPRERIAVPGFPDLCSFSKAYQPMLQENLGGSITSFLRVGNFRMAMGHPRIGQKWAAEWLVKSVQENKLRAVFLTRFPSMNHCVIVYRAFPQPNGDVHFLVYDPNYEGQFAHLDYVAARRSFDMERRWYFPGGQVNVMRVYISPFH